MKGFRGELYGQGLSFPVHYFQGTARSPISDCPKSRGKKDLTPLQEGAWRKLLGLSKRQELELGAWNSDYSLSFAPSTGDLGLITLPPGSLFLLDNEEFGLYHL